MATLSGFDKNTLYITLQYVRTEGGQRKYHWGLYNSGSQPPAGWLAHATDAGRVPLDLYKELRPVSDPRKSSTLVVALNIARSPGLEALESCAGAVRLMDSRYLPRGESKWTCRVWVKEVLGLLQSKGYIGLPADLDTIERHCQAMADGNIKYMGSARVLNDVMHWTDPESFTTPDTLKLMDGKSGLYYGSSPMDIDSTGTYLYSTGSKPMVADSSSGTYFV